MSDIVHAPFHCRGRAAAKPALSYEGGVREQLTENRPQAIFLTDPKYPMVAVPDCPRPQVPMSPSKTDPHAALSRQTDRRVRPGQRTSRRLPAAHPGRHAVRLLPSRRAREIAEPRTAPCPNPHPATVRFSISPDSSAWPTIIPIWRARAGPRIRFHRRSTYTPISSGNRPTQFRCAPPKSFWTFSGRAGRQRPGRAQADARSRSSWGRIPRRWSSSWRRSRSRRTRGLRSRFSA